MRLGRQLRNIGGAMALGAVGGAIGGAFSDNNTMMTGMKQGALMGLGVAGAGYGLNRMMRNKSFTESVAKFKTAQSNWFNSAATAGSRNPFTRMRATMGMNASSAEMRDARKARLLSRISGGIGGRTMAAAGLGAGAMTYAVLPSNGGGMNTTLSNATLAQRLEYLRQARSRQQM